MVNSITSSIVPLHGAASSLIGGRSENQDDLGWVDTPLGFLLVICDGMGGGPGGKTASYIAKTTFMHVIYNSPAQANRHEVLRMAVARAEEAIEQKMIEVPFLRGMGSTLVAILINEESAIVTHLGDSRCYRLHGFSILFQSQDHSLVGELVRCKALTEEQARVSPQSNVITRGLGSTNNHVAEINEVPFRQGDKFVLCTDGVWGIMPQTELILRLAQKQDVLHVVTTMQDEVDRIGSSEGGHHDNHTLAIVELKTDSILKERMSKQIKIILASLGCLFFVSAILNIIMLQLIGKEPSRAEYELLLAKNSQLSEKNDILIDAQDGEYVAIYTQNKKLEAEIQELQRLLNTSRHLTDSLQKELDIAKHYQDQTQTPTNKGRGSSLTDSKEQPGIGYLDDILQELKKMKQCKDKMKWQNVQEKQNASKKVILNALKELDKVTKNRFHSELSDIQKHLNAKDCIALKIDNHQRDGYYGPTNMAIDDINVLINKVEGLRKRVEKQ